MSFVLSSTSIKDGGRMPQAQVFNGMGQSGNNLSPQLSWSGAPEGTKSFVVTLYDPDAPTGSGWWHWTLVNIPATVTSLAEGASSSGELPPGALQTRTDFGGNAYGGAAPPPGGDHRYIFTVHALKVEKLDVDADASGAMVGFYVHFNALASATLTVLYGA